MGKVHVTGSVYAYAYYIQTDISASKAYSDVLQDSIIKNILPSVLKACICMSF